MSENVEWEDQEEQEKMSTEEIRRVFPIELLFAGSRKMDISEMEWK